MKCFNLIAGYSRILKVVILSKKVEPVCFAVRFRYSVKVNKICHPLWPFHAMRPRWIPNVAILSNDGQLTRASLFTSTAFQCDDKWLQLMMTYDELWRAVVKSRKSIAGDFSSKSFALISSIVQPLLREVCNSRSSIVCKLTGRPWKLESNRD